MVTFGCFGRLSREMSTNGRPRKASPAESAEVRRLAAAGLSVRVIAAQVFGDARFRGRVERILRRPTDAAEAPEAVQAREADLREFERLDRAGQLRWLLDRRLAMWAAREEGPSGRELRSLVEVDHQLRMLEAFNRLQRLQGLEQHPESDEPK